MDDPVAELVELLARLPGIGERTAARLAYHLLGAPADYAKALGEAVATIHERVRPCGTCGNWTTAPECGICVDPKRDESTLCIVARPQDVAAMERGGSYRGRYHVLHKLLSPLDGVGPDALDVAGLRTRVTKHTPREIIIATPLSVEGEATALYLAQELKSTRVPCTRIASGLPHGGELEFSDPITLARAVEGRREL